MKKEVKKNRRKNVKWMAAAVLTATLLSSQVMPSVAAGSDTEISVSTIIPENITIEYPVPLSEISLPSSEYGKLSWADDSLVPSRRSEAFEVVFRPSDSFDLSRIEDWDGESEKITGYITVVVSSITQSDEESWDEEYDTSAEDYQEENGGLEEAQGDEFPEGTADPVDAEENNIEENNTEDTEESNTEEQNSQEEQTPDSDPEASETPQGDPQTDSDNSEEDGEANAEEADPSDQQTADPEEGTKPSEENNEADHKQDTEEESEEDPEDITGEDKKEGENQEDGTTQDNGEGTGDQQEEQKDPSETETPAPGEIPEDETTEGESPDGDPAEDGTQQEDPDNIFDRPQEDTEDDRPVTAEDDLTEEEMAFRAQENHSSNGIYVSGINLPWYVQFRATSGESYEFTNESHANIFRSYEFELWDLKNDTEYEIPDGEYISVTIPVKEGYEYTIEHLLDNGATETIIPSVEGSTMIFSTHSFSPFGIAGSKPLVGGEVSENTYLTPTPTLAPTKAPSGNTGNNSTTGTNTGNGNNTGTNNPAGGNNNINGAGSTVLVGPNGAGSNSGEPTKDKSGYSTKVTPTPASADDNSSGSAQTGNGSGNGNGASDYTDQANKSAQNTSSVNAVKTGDNTQILPFVILVAAAAVIIAAVLFLKKKKQ